MTSQGRAVIVLQVNQIRRCDIPENETIKQYQERMRCTCPIKPGMTFFQLRALGAGCTSGSHVCPVLTKARSNVRQPNAEERAADDLALAKSLKIGKGVGVR